MKAKIELYQVTFSISTDYDKKEEIHFNALVAKALKLSFVDESMIESFDPDYTYTQNVVSPTPRILTGDNLIELACSGFQYKVDQKVTTHVDIHKQIAELAEKPITLTTEGGGNEYNTVCEVHMPGQALSLYNEVKVVIDSCTDVIQEELINGWRIIAACPQPDQRRPDYVLGRYNPKIGE